MRQSNVAATESLQLMANLQLPTENLNTEMKEAIQEADGISYNNETAHIPTNHLFDRRSKHKKLVIHSVD
ncbi:hypothetical protein [Alkalihalobacillus pseudalcaliphilus]|uniref:hypothetical protein n=1 Tax=Alkalihalobacillus pseudalcaliphilus TaxID=79884 RepID=UPI00064D7774|nr:hypothetical protein [Alkalihalobacillus pseudalcaliphilus]KMK78149.1 hypothetical protein AB990_01545 [Alkalihalobacillus pseudalcaliphilus]